MKPTIVQILAARLIVAAHEKLNEPTPPRIRKIAETKFGSETEH